MDKNILDVKNISAMIKERRIQKGLTQGQLSEKFGRSYQLVQKWESGRGKPTVMQLQVVSKTLDIPLEELVRSLSSLEQNERHALESSISAEEIGEHTTTEELAPRQRVNSVYVEIPFLSAKAQAGPATTVLSDCEAFTGDTYPVLKKLIDKQHKYLAIGLTGHSMVPSLLSDSIVLAQLVDQSDVPYESGGVYAVRYADRLVVKRIRTNELRTKGELTLHSDNERFGQIIVPVDEIQCVWRVKCLVFQPVD